MTFTSNFALCIINSSNLLHMFHLTQFTFIHWPTMARWEETMWNQSGSTWCPVTYDTWVFTVLLWVFHIIPRTRQLTLTHEMEVSVTLFFKNQALNIGNEPAVLKIASLNLRISGWKIYINYDVKINVQHSKNFALCCQISSKSYILNCLIPIDEFLSLSFINSLNPLIDWWKLIRITLMKPNQEYGLELNLLSTIWMGHMKMYLIIHCCVDPIISEITPLCP